MSDTIEDEIAELREQHAAALRQGERGEAWQLAQRIRELEIELGARRRA